MRLPSALIAAALLVLAACVAPAPDPSTSPVAAQPARPSAPATGQPAASPGTTAVDRSCRTDADCTVKDVGSCCGHYPACVNVDSPTDPKGVQAACAKEGMMSVCGFPEIASCTCRQGQCEAGPAQALQ